MDTNWNGKHYLPFMAIVCFCLTSGVMNMTDLPRTVVTENHMQNQTSVFLTTVSSRSSDVLTVTDGKECGKRFEKWGSSCLVISTVEIKHEKGNELCEEIGGRLVMIYTDKIYDSVQSYLRSSSLRKTSYFWVGNMDDLDPPYFWPKKPTHIKQEVALKATVEGKVVTFSLEYQDAISELSIVCEEYNNSKFRYV
ncbi:uncharacterized protein LOC143236755 [Tachypleus tridentatus]|uniref:uncharacterized protein LOC143236755 n=1 Tax=Tachypleus tridentatus TaxID=6853 RepID=UPI003FD60EC4